MNVRLEHRFASDSYRVWFFEQHPFRVYLWVEAPNGWMWFEADPNAECEPSLEIRTDLLEALLAEAGKVLPATHATERHLLDAIATRDRLLTLVEAGWEA